MHVKELQAHNFGKTHNLGVLGVLRILAIFMWPLLPIIVKPKEMQKDNIVLLLIA